MNKIIVAIGGGENGRLLENGKYASYDTEKIDKEIVNLTGKGKPNFLFLGHAMNFLPEVEKSYYETMKNIYGDKLGCNCNHLLSSELNNKEIVEAKIKWADIVYEGGGDTSSMMNLWINSNFDKVLYNAYNDGKIICGVSAGGVCWFKSCNSDSGNVKDVFNSIDCLKWINLHVTPHCNEKGRMEAAKRQLKVNKLNGLCLSNSSAIIIKDNEYRILVDNNDACVYLSSWIDDRYIIKNITNNNNFNSVEDLLDTNYMIKEDNNE